MNGAEYIAEFLAQVGARRVFVLTGGAVAFMIDAVGRHPKLSYTCFQHEQSAAMAADAIWRTDRSVGVAMATSGPGATNLITGIACSYFDSIPTLHITGQVNQRESCAYEGMNIRQSGFQETDIVSMVRPITKYAASVKTGEELRHELLKAYEIAISGRMGPVLLDVPMDIQQIEIEGDVLRPSATKVNSENVASTRDALAKLLETAKRPVVLWGAGVGLAGIEDETSKWLSESGIPFVSSWAGMTYFDHDHPGFLGQIGVYGNRGANFVLQNADTVIVIGSRLDNRQRSGNANNFASGAQVHVIDIDSEELKKCVADGYTTSRLDFSNLPAVLNHLPKIELTSAWRSYVGEMKEAYFGREISTSATRLNSLSPYDVIRRMNELIDDDAIVAVDTGACVCWVHQAFKVKSHTLFTAGGNSPMGYALPAAIGAKLAKPDLQVVSFNGDGGFQVNLQELQTLKHYNLNVVVVIMNNASYGIIKQFQDSYLGSRYTASRDGYSVPDFGRIAAAYGLGYARIESIDQIRPDLFRSGPIIVDVQLSEHTLIEPKLEMGRPINDQFPYLDEKAYASGNRFVNYPRPGSIGSDRS